MAGSSSPVQHQVIIIAGPTASGKSSYAETLARKIGGEIINADSVQMYTRLSVGTAKPDWKASDIKHHLFDICKQPQDFDVVQYRRFVEETVCDVLNRGSVPILVGGSLFYIKSLFYPPSGKIEKKARRISDFENIGNYELWCRLKSIDSERAQQIHCNDRYRVERALAVWQEFGKKPSTLKPEYRPMFAAEVVFLSPPLPILYERINVRTVAMIEKMGWLDEARDVFGDDVWKEFVCTKKFIGYPELFEWIAAGQHEQLLPDVVAKIQQKTRQYAKRQRTFWKSFCSQLSAENDSGISVKVVDVSD